MTMDMNLIMSILLLYYYWHDLLIRFFYPYNFNIVYSNNLHALPNSKIGQSLIHLLFIDSFSNFRMFGLGTHPQHSTLKLMVH